MGEGFYFPRGVVGRPSKVMMRLAASLFVVTLLLPGCATSPKTIWLRPTTLVPLGEGPVRISYIHKDSPAAKSGMRVGDIITGVNGQPVTNWDDAARLTGEIRERGTISVARDAQALDLAFSGFNGSSESSGILFFQERFALQFPDGRYTDTQTKSGVGVGITGAVTAESGSSVAFVLWVMNHSDETISISPEDILILDGHRSILKIYGAETFAIAAGQSAQAKFDTYANLSSAQVAAAASQPPTYDITGSSTTYGSGNIHSYGNYGHYTYSGSTYSSYQATPQPNYSATGAMLGQAIGLMIARKRLEKEQQLAQSMYANAFQFGEVPGGTNRRGILLCDAPPAYPLRIRVTLGGNEYQFELEQEIQGK